MKTFLVLTMACMFAGTLLASTITNGSFETPALAPGSFQYDPSGATWVFSGPAGIASNGSAFNFVSAPDGTQEAFLQASEGTNSFSQTITGVLAGDAIKFSWAQRPGFGADTVTVTYNGVTLFSGAPSSTTWSTVTTSSIASGQPSSGLLVFSGSTVLGVDLDTGIDDITSVSASTVPEPISAVLFGSGLLAVSFLRRRDTNRN
jgi:hypothetical protein